MADDLDLVFESADYDRPRLVATFAKQGVNWFREWTDARGETETLLCYPFGVVRVPHFDLDLLSDRVAYRTSDPATGESVAVMLSESSARLIKRRKWAFVRMSWGNSEAQTEALFTGLLDLADAMTREGLGFRIWYDENTEITRERLIAEAEQQARRAAFGAALFGTVKPTE